MGVSGRLYSPGASTRTWPVSSITPLRKTIEEMCPSPVARRLMANLTDPGGKPVWSTDGTMEGLKSAADSIAYSMVK